MKYQGLYKKLSFSHPSTGSTRGHKTQRFNQVKSKAESLFMNAINRGQDFVDNRSSSITSKLPKIKKIKNYKKYLVYLGLIIAIFFVGKFAIVGIGDTEESLDNSGRVEVKGAKSVQEINKEFTFPLKDADGKEISRIKYVLQRAEKRDEIVVQGQKASAISGRTFLILTIKITNEHNQPIEIETRDYIRLSINNNEDEWLAPDIHNDPVEVQAISTKFTRAGFPINDDDKNLVVRIGEINGDKDRIELDL
jgi:hypothetical protein